MVVQVVTFQHGKANETKILGKLYIITAVLYYSSYYNYLLGFLKKFILVTCLIPGVANSQETVIYFQQ